MPRKEFYNKFIPNKTPQALQKKVNDWFYKKAMSYF